MKPELMPLREAASAPRFISEELREKHVVKHVFKGRLEKPSDSGVAKYGSEGWHKIIGPERVRQARRAYYDGEKGPEYDEVALVYERMLADAVVRACKAGRWHCHSAECAFRNLGDGEMELIALAQVIDVWPPEAGLIVGAIAFVRNDTLEPYRLLTGFRPWPGLGKRAFVRKGRARALERIRLRPLRLLALHE